MVKAAQDRVAAEDAGLATIPDFWRSQAQAPVRPIPVVVSDELAQDRQKLILTQHDQVVEALPAERADHPLRYSIRLGGQHWRADSADAQSPQPRIEVRAIHAIAVMD